MSLETVSERRRKRVVEHVIAGFNSANQAIVFGNTVEELVNQQAGAQKFRQWIAKPGSDIAITEDWHGPTTLKTTFLELDQDIALLICEQMKRAASIHSDVHGKINIEQEIVREKPQPQFVTL